MISKLENLNVKEPALLIKNRLPFLWCQTILTFFSFFRTYFPFFDSAAASLNCLNENVLGSESATHLAFHITLLDHVGVETGREGTLELVPHIYSSLDI